MHRRWTIPRWHVYRLDCIELQLHTCDSYLAGHPHSTIQSNARPIQHAVLQHLCYHPCELTWLPCSRWELHHSFEAGHRLWVQHFGHFGIEHPWRNRDNAYTVSRKFSRQWKCQRYYGTFGGTVCNLPRLTVKSCYRGYKDKHTTLPIVHCCRFQRYQCRKDLAT